MRGVEGERAAAVLAPDRLPSRDARAAAGGGAGSQAGVSRTKKLLPRPPAPLPGIHFRGHAAWNLLQYFRSKQHVQLIGGVLNLFFLGPETQGPGRRWSVSAQGSGQAAPGDPAPQLPPFLFLNVFLLVRTTDRGPCSPHWGSNLQPSLCPDWESNHDLLVHSPTLSP